MGPQGPPGQVGPQGPVGPPGTGTTGGMPPLLDPAPRMVVHTIVRGELDVQASAVLWATVPNPVPAPKARSAYSGAPIDVDDAIRAGTIVEKAITLPFPVSTHNDDIRARMVAEWAKWQARVNEIPR